MATGYCAGLMRRAVALPILLGLALLLSTGAGAGDRPPVTIIWLNGPGEEVVIGEEFTVTVTVDECGWEMLSASLVVSFDVTKLQVMDDDGVTPGVQITPGECPQPDFVPDNRADNTAGTITYAAEAESACYGGLIATIRFEAVGLGTTALDFLDSWLGDSSGNPVHHVANGTTVVIGGSPVEELTWGTIKALYQ
jgi:hypothetical protein